MAIFPHARHWLMVAVLSVGLAGCATSTSPPEPPSAASRPMGQRLGQGVITGVRYAVGAPFVTAMVLVAPLVGASPVEMASLYRKLGDDSASDRRRVPPPDAGLESGPDPGRPVSRR